MMLCAAEVPPPAAVTLSEAVGLAVSRGHDLRILSLDVESGRRAEQGADAGYRPRVDALADWSTLSDPPSALISGRQMQMSDRENLKARVVVEQTLFDFGKTGHRLGQAQARTDVARGVLAASRERVALDAVTAFLFARRAEELYSVAKETLETAKAHRAVAKALYDGGTVPMNDVLAADVAVANAESAAISARNAVELSRARLALRLGLPGSSSVAPVGDLPRLPESFPSVDESVSLAHRSRFELKAFEYSVRESTERRDEARAGSYPTFFGAGGWSYETNEFNPYKSVFSVGVGGRVNLYAGGADTASARQASVIADRRREEAARAKDEIALEVKSAHLSLGDASARRDSARVAVERATENLRIQDTRYREGLAIAAEERDAQDLLSKARLDEKNSSFDLLEASARLLYARGELLSAVGSPEPAR